MRRIAFFGGSFDPPHRGHLAIAKAAADQFALDEVLFAPVAQQPLKNAQEATPFLHRYAMTVLATQADARFVPSLLDAPRESGPRPNYTVETLERLRVSLAESTEPTMLFTLLGADSWVDIARWHQAIRLLTLTDWIVAARPGFSLANAERALPPTIATEQANHASGSMLVLQHADGTWTHVYFIRSVWDDLSATELRRALVAGHADAELLPAPVWKYIQKTGLYQARQSERREESRG